MVSSLLRSEHLNVPRVVFKITTNDRPWYPEKNLHVFYSIDCDCAQCYSLSTQLNRHETKDNVRQKFFSCTNMRASTHTDMHTTPLYLSAYSRSHYMLTRTKRKRFYNSIYSTTHYTHNTQHRNDPNQHIATPNLLAKLCLTRLLAYCQLPLNLPSYPALVTSCTLWPHTTEV